MQNGLPDPQSYCSSTSPFVRFPSAVSTLHPPQIEAPLSGQADPQPLTARGKKKAAAAAAAAAAQKQLSAAPSTPRASAEGGDPARHRAEYRFHILLSVPSLKKLDFSPLTVIEKENAQIWRQRLDGQRSARLNRD